MSNDNTILTNFADTILNLDNSIRWIGITNHNGIIINEKYREGLKLLLNKEENQESAINTIIRHKTRAKFEPKIGKLTYAFGRYDKFSRFIIPLNENYYLIITIDYSENNFDKMIMDKLFPLIKEVNKNFSN